MLKLFILFLLISYSLGQLDPYDPSFSPDLQWFVKETILGGENGIGDGEIGFSQVAISITGECFSFGNGDFLGPTVEIFDWDNSVTKRKTIDLESVLGENDAEVWRSGSVNNDCTEFQSNIVSEIYTINTLTNLADRSTWPFFNTEIPFLVGEGVTVVFPPTNNKVPSEFHVYQLQATTNDPVTKLALSKNGVFVDSVDNPVGPNIINSNEKNAATSISYDSISNHIVVTSGQENNITTFFKIENDQLISLQDPLDFGGTNGAISPTGNYVVLASGNAYDQPFCGESGYDPCIDRFDVPQGLMLLVFDSSTNKYVEADFFNSNKNNCFGNGQLSVTQNGYVFVGSYDFEKNPNSNDAQPSCAVVGADEGSNGQVDIFFIHPIKHEIEFVKTISSPIGGDAYFGDSVVCDEFGDKFLVGAPGSNGFSGALLMFESIIDAQTRTPTVQPAPSAAPSTSATASPSKAPTKKPTDAVTNSPSKAPTKKPTDSPSKAPTKKPTDAPISNNSPTDAPTKKPTDSPSKAPTQKPTDSPTEAPIIGTRSPTLPTKSPTKGPTNSPSKKPTDSPTKKPTTGIPTRSPSKKPTDSPSTKPTKSPTTPEPTNSPTTFVPTIASDTTDPEVAAGLVAFFAVTWSGMTIFFLFFA